MKSSFKCESCCDRRSDAGFYEPLTDNIVLEPINSPTHTTAHGNNRKHSQYES